MTAAPNAMTASGRRTRRKCSAANATAEGGNNKQARNQAVRVRTARINNPTKPAAISSPPRIKK